MKKQFYLVLWVCCLCTTLYAQNFVQQKLWVLDNQRIDFQQDPPQVRPNLPQYPTGSTPRFGGVNGIHNAQGELLFYIDSQNDIKNKMGDPIGSLPMPKGSSEMCVIPMPGSSCKHYVIYLDNIITDPGICPLTQITSNNLNYTIVDLSLNNNQGGTTNPVSPPEFCSHILGGVLAVSPLVAGGTKRYLYKVGFNPGSFDIRKYEITATGIGTPTTIYTSPGNLSAALANIRSAEADLSLDGTKLAFANERTGNTNNDVFVIHLNASGNLASTAGNQGNGTSIFNVISNSTNEFTGVEFSPNGNNLFVGQVGEGIHKIDVATGSTSTLSGSNNYGNSHLELGYSPTGIHKIWATNGTQLGSINLPNSSTPSFAGGVVNGVAPYTAAIYSFAFQLPDQIDGFNYDEPFNNIEPTCCVALTNFDEDDYIATTNATWTAISNPFSVPSVKIEGILTIPSGKSITIKDMTFEFGPDAQIIVQKGARLTIDNSTLTSIGCENLWKGIDVAGINGSSQYAINSSTGLREQGHLIIRNNALIENAKEAIRLVLGNDVLTTGGIVWATNSTFRNNWRCAEFIKYQNKTLQGVATKNISYFKDCIFETTADVLNNGQSPYYFVTMWAVDGVGLLGNTFKNTSNQTDVLKRGNGIKSIDAKYSVQGYCTASTPYGTPCPANSVVRNIFKNLAYGIDATSSNVMNTVSITNNEFDNNWRGILLRGMDFARVTENIFNVGERVNILSGESYGLYTDHCSGYKIEGNAFFSTHFGMFGTYTWNSGTAPNRIYRNTFNNIGIGSVASQTNGQVITHTPGLEYRCNSYNCTVMDIALTSGAIAQNQGYCHITSGSDPAGNTFTPSSNILFNLYKNPNATPFYYFFHSSAGIYNPVKVSLNIPTSSTNCNAYNALADCKTTLYPNPNIVKGEKQQLSNDLAQQKSLIDNGNTALLVASLATLSPGQAKNAMMAVSPYASDAALLAYLGKNPPSGHLNQVISANSPVTTTVWSRIEQMNIPNGIKNQLTALQTGISARAELEGSLAYYEKEIWLLTDELIRYYLNDTIVTDPMDSVIVLLKEQNRQTMKCQQLAAEIKAEKLADADATVAAIATAQGGQITDNYCKLLSILLELEKASLSCLNMSSPDENTVRDIAADDTKRGCAQAKALLNIAFNESFPETIEEIQFSNTALREAGNADLEIHQERTQTEVQNTSENNSNTALSDQTYSLNTYPNPFDKILTVNTTIPDNVEHAEFMLYDVLGKQLKRIRLAKGASVVEINGEELQEGILYYVLILDDKIVENGKVIYMRKVSDK